MIRFAVIGLAGLLLIGCDKPEPSAVPAEAYTVSATISTNRIFIGEPVILTVNVVHPTNTTVELPDLERDAELRVRSTHSEANPLTPELLHTLYTFQITSFRTGDHVICTNDIVFVTGEDETEPEPFPFLALEVLSSLEEGSTLTNAKGLAEWPGGVPTWIVGLIIVGVLAFAVASVVVWIVSRREPATKPPPPLPPAHLTAREAIERLKRKQYIEQGHLEPFYVELSAIIRHYLERRFKIHAPELTTEEFLREATNSRLLNAEHQSACRLFLEQCDLVKFAKFRPGEPEMRNALAAAEQLIEETREQEAVSP